MSVSVLQLSSFLSFFSSNKFIFITCISDIWGIAYTLYKEYHIFVFLFVTYFTWFETIINSAAMNSLVYIFR